MNLQWDEPEGCTTPRGWLSRDDIGAVANYLDYGDGHYRSLHEYCSAQHPCRECQPGNIHVVAYRVPQGFYDWGRSYGERYCETIEEAKVWAEEIALTIA